MEEERRVVLDCRDFPTSNCSVTITGPESEVLELAEIHATMKHGVKKAPALREKLRSSLKADARKHWSE